MTSTNGVGRTASPPNGVWQNGVWQNGIWQNGVWQNGLPAVTLESSQYARQLLQSVYACAMPGTLDSAGSTCALRWVVPGSSPSTSTTRSPVR
jgi:hypothetical protein